MIVILLEDMLAPLTNSRKKNFHKTTGKLLQLYFTERERVIEVCIQHIFRLFFFGCEWRRKSMELEKLCERNTAGVKIAINQYYWNSIWTPSIFLLFQTYVNSVIDLREENRKSFFSSSSCFFTS